jgi:pre-mRNA-processing factor 17
VCFDSHVHRRHVANATSPCHTRTEYRGHTATINTLTLLPGGKRFLTSAEDVTLRLWELDEGECLQELKDEWMKGMPGACMSTAQDLLCFTSLDNRIKTYTVSPTTGDIAPSRRGWGGHHVGGHALTPALSPNTAYVASGDADGDIWMWDATTGKVGRRMRSVHAGVVMQVLWMPHDTSKVLSCSWDGTIKLWD